MVTKVTLSNASAFLSPVDQRYRVKQENSPRDRTDSASTSHNLANMSTAQKQPVLKDGQIDESRKPQDHQDRIDREHGILVEKAAAVFTVVGNGQSWVEEEVGQGEEGDDGAYEGEED